MNLSKKLTVAAAGTILALLSKWVPGLELDETALVTILSPLIAYILGQSVVDIGKSKSLVEEETKRLLANHLTSRSKADES